MNIIENTVSHAFGLWQETSIMAKLAVATSLLMVATGVWVIGIFFQFTFKETNLKEQYMFYKRQPKKYVSDSFEEVYSEEMEEIFKDPSVKELRKKALMCGMFYDNDDNGEEYAEEQLLQLTGFMLQVADVDDNVRATFKDYDLEVLKISEQDVIRGDFFSTSYYGRRVGLWKVFSQIKNWFAVRTVAGKAKDNIVYKPTVHIEVFFPVQIVFIFPIPENQTRNEWCHPEASKKLK